jgi:hypothetical protein
VNDGRWLGGTGDPAEAELRKALDDAKLRGPDDVMLRRMWAKLGEDPHGVGHEVARRRRAPRWFWFASGMVSMAAVTLAALLWLWPRTLAPLPTVSTSTIQPVVVGPGTVRTGEGETLPLTLRGGTKAVLGSSSVMKLAADYTPSVEGGEVGFTVPHQPLGHTYVVHAGPYRVIVVGTKFRLSVDGAENHRRVMVAVDDGVVEIWQHERLARLLRGQSWTSPEETSEATAETTSVTTPIEPAPMAASRRVSLHFAARARREAHARTVALATPVQPAPPVAASAAPAEQPVVAPAATPAAAAPAPDSAAQAHAALAAGDVSRALALYRALAQKGGAAGENAEYEMGKVLRDRLGQPANALSTWRRYRSEHPDGILRIETDVSIIETLVHAGDADGALSEANDFLRRHPDSERRGEIARIAGDLLRARGDCRHAVAAYQSALSSPRAAAVAEAAMFHRASCLVQLGDPAGVDSARDYLRAWPEGRFRAEASRLVMVAGARDSEGAAGRP